MLLGLPFFHEFQPVFPPVLFNKFDKILHCVETCLPFKASFFRLFAEKFVRVHSFSFAAVVTNYFVDIFAFNYTINHGKLFNPAIVLSENIPDKQLVLFSLIKKIAETLLPLPFHHCKNQPIKKWLLRFKTAFKLKASGE